MIDINDYEVIQNLKNFKKIIKNKQTNKVSLYDLKKNKIILDNYNELTVYQHDDTEYAATNSNGKCGIFDISTQKWIFPEIYDKIRIIPATDTLQEGINISCMCVLESYGNSTLFSFSRNQDGKYLLKQIVPADTYDDIQTQLFEDIRSSYSFGKKSVFSDSVLYIELTKNKKKGCIIFNKENDGKINKIIQVDCKYDDLRPSLFDGKDDLNLSHGESYRNSDCYLFETVPYVVGNLGKKQIKRTLIVNNSKCVNTLRKKLLIYKQNNLWGVLHNSEEIISAQFGPLFTMNTDKDDEYKTSFKGTNLNGKVHEFISYLDERWNKNLIIKTYEENNEQVSAKNFLKILGVFPNER